ncbi:UDP-N-acetylmuramoyl-L-alanine--D-glutamate ligase [Arthrobacter sp. zg-Y1110]|uniref:UDP-N-acetylmuramoyl-L-alanine--D-glutamate ligase n=1 Tax=Arthrobacter sp. zg-Y1110 TaxID=2886932 RepID=UPI001D147248|nr:UDP-N-acetylmuramoyl-L-alanine--D-glutamate ligase [Arthrobacter sp. zg-Y1110]MCC3290715.1 UDP-N-acetylmuramoyl-L-alanine--D-glutamate ligase [Arthrobacter sp. zg-Y1110]UWX86131.1 UDP-N-acetylmuramoyl-L-alanine--D-glutamate ligase [Arthrobacter sp. zg-Y1110]
MGGGTVSAPLAELTTWDADWSGLRVVVTGIGLSGFSAADTLIELGARVVVVDARDTEENRAKADTLRIVGAADILLGADAVAGLPEVDGAAPDLVVTSPGFRPTHPVLAAAAAADIPVWGDVELAWRVRIREGRKTAQWLAITGTNGKTTTVSMTESMLRAAGLRAIAAGNVGTPILDAIRDPEGYDAIAVELSSFQLHWTHSMSPLASVCLNIAEDHVDWHGSYEAYLADKAKIYENTQVACIYNAEQYETEHMVEEADVVEGCRAVGFTTSVPAVSMVGVVEGLLVDRAFIEQRKDSAAELAAMADLGEYAPRHMVANALAAAALVRALGVEPAAVRDGLRAYAPGDHRIQPVARLNDILWVNDSKATNPHAAAASLAAFTSVVWIAGGLSKGVHYNDLVAEHRGRLKAVVLIGADTADLQAALAQHAPDVPVIHALVEQTGERPLTAAPVTSAEEIMVRAVAAAATVAEAGDTVLMAPAAASMDQFTSYAHRGEAFIEAVAGYMSEQQAPGQAQTPKEP